MRITIAQLNYHVGDFASNTDKVLKAISEAKRDGSDLVLFSELSVSGYPPLDLLEHSDFIGHCDKAISRIKTECTDITNLIII